VGQKKTYSWGGQLVCARGGEKSPFRVVEHLGKAEVFNQCSTSVQPFNHWVVEHLQK